MKTSHFRRCDMKKIMYMHGGKFGAHPPAKHYLDNGFLSQNVKEDKPKKQRMKVKRKKH